MAQNWFEGFVENLDVDYTYAFIAEYAEEGGTLFIAKCSYIQWKTYNE